MLLAIDTATRSGSVAVLAQSQVVRQIELGDRNHAAALGPAVVELLAAYGSPAGYGIDCGPGSFTGLRVGVAFLKGLARARPAPVASLGSLEVLAAAALENAPSMGRALCVLKANGRFVFAGAFVRGPELRPVAAPALAVGLYDRDDVLAAIRSEVAPTVLAGEGLGELEVPEGWIRSNELVPRAPYVARIAERVLGEGGGGPAAELEPAYHQPSAAEAKRAGSL